MESVLTSTAEKILEIIEKNQKPLTIQGVAERANIKFVAARAAVQFLERLAVIEVIRAGRITIVRRKEI